MNNKIRNQIYENSRKSPWNQIDSQIDNKLYNKLHEHFYVQMVFRSWVEIWEQIKHEKC